MSEGAGIDWEAEGLLEGLDDEAAREARRGLLEHLSGEGCELDELKEAVAEGRLALLPSEKVLEGGGGRFTPDEVAERSGVDREFLDRLWRALGQALAGEDDRVFSQADVEAAQAVKRFRDAGFPDDGILEITRVMSQSLARLAASIGARFGEVVFKEGDTELDLAVRSAESTRELSPLLGPVMENVLSLQHRQLIRQAVLGNADLTSGRVANTQPIAVCFTDLVDFTKLGERVQPEELGAVTDRLEEMASHAAVSSVRLVKTIGDAAMLVSSDPDALIEAALALVEAADEEGEGFPPMHAGLAYGEALARGGDWYGRPVNLAARVTDFAKPSSVLATNELREAAKGDYRWSRAGMRKFKGISGEVGVNRVRRPEPEEEPQG